VSKPLVGIVVVNYNGGTETLQCLDSVATLDWPADRLRLVLVDNASTDGVADQVEAERPAVTVVRSPVNVGFAGGCNLAFAHLAGVDHVALVNPDAVLESTWLRAAADVLASAPDVGAVASKVLLDGRFAEVTLDVPTAVRGRGDNRPLGVRVSGARVDGEDVWQNVQLSAGFWGPEHGRDEELSYQWSAGHAVLRLPSGASGQLRLAADHDTTVTVTAGAAKVEVPVSRSPTWFRISLERAGGCAVINSAGVVLLDDGYGADRGYLAPDDGRFDTREEVFAWSGSAVLLSGRYLREVGGFGERYFMYYEDFDLSWRGRRQGWRYVYEPHARVHHRHATSSVIGSPLFDHHVERNRLVTVLRNAPSTFALRAVVRFLLITASYARRDVLSPLLRGRRPAPTIASRRLRSFAGFVRLLPTTLADRRRLRRRRRVDDGDVLAWLGRT
jgi:GT2 family glycosyltransferase